MANSKITAVGLGPAGPEYLTAQTRALLDGAAPVWLRTSVHPAADGLDVAGSFDGLYETLDSFENVYTTIVARLIELAATEGEVVYAVPGSPAVAEHTIELLREHDAVTGGEVELVIHPAMGFADLCWNALGIDPMAVAVTIVDALSIVTQGIGRRGPLLITQVHSAEVLDDLIAVLDDSGPETVTVLQGLGTANEFVREVPWADLRSSVEPDHLTSLWLPHLSEPLGVAFARLDELVRSARDASDQPVEDALGALRDSMPAAALAVRDAIDRVLEHVEDAEFDLEDALADLLHLLVANSRLAAEAGFFTIEELADSASERYL